MEVLMPVITAEGDDGVVTAWLVDEGAAVTEGALIAEVQAEKVAADVHAPTAGIVEGRVAINEPVPQGSPICRIVAAAAAAPAQVPGAEPGRPAAGEATPDRVIASPSARRVARELGVDLAEVTGSGDGGRITEADVRAAAAGSGGGGEELSGLRAVIARNMRHSASTTAAVTLTGQADLTDAPTDGLTARTVAAAARALLDHPALNGTTDGDRFLAGDGVHVGVAIQTPEGLLAPVIRDADAKTPEAIADEIAELASRAEHHHLTAADFEGGTFSVSNLGAYGIDAFTPIINPPQVAILGVGALRTVPGFDEGGTVIPRSVMTLSLTFDHAFVDGAPAAEFLGAVRAQLQAPS